VTVLWLLLLILEGIGYKVPVDSAVYAMKIGVGVLLAGAVILWIADNWHKDRHVDWLNPTNPLRRNKND
jgi:hypothetical protein